MSPADAAENSNVSGLSNQLADSDRPSYRRGRARHPRPRKQGQWNERVGESLPPPSSSTKPKTPDVRSNASIKPAAGSEVSNQKASVPSTHRFATRRRRNNRRRADSNTTQATALSIDDDSPPNAFSSQQIDDSARDVSSRAQIDSHVPKNDIAQDIRDLVDHVRSVALESHQPNSTGTHIDWAGDDDDSLPDLDDWGFTSKSLGVISDSVAHPSEFQGITASSSELSVLSDVAQPKAISSPEARNIVASGNSIIPPGMPIETPRYANKQRAQKDSKDKKKSLDTSKLHAYLGSPDAITVPSKKTLLQRIGPTIDSGSPASGYLSNLTKPNHPNVPLKAAQLTTKPNSDNRGGQVRLHSDPKAIERVILPPVSMSGMANNGEIRSCKKTGDRSAAAEDASSVTSNRTSETRVELVSESGKFNWADEPVQPLDDYVASTKSPKLSEEPAEPVEDAMPPPSRHRPENGVSWKVHPGGATSGRRRRRQPETDKTSNTPDFGATRPKLHRDALALISKSLKDSSSRQHLPHTGQ